MVALKNTYICKKSWAEDVMGPLVFFLADSLAVHATHRHATFFCAHSVWIICKMFLKGACITKLSPGFWTTCKKNFTDMYFLWTMSRLNTKCFIKSLPSTPSMWKKVLLQKQSVCKQSCFTFKMNGQSSALQWKLALIPIFLKKVLL